MAVFLIHFTHVNHKTGQHYFVNFEADVDTVAELTEQFNADGLVAGRRLWTKPGSVPGETEVTGRTEIAINAASVHTIEVPKNRYVQYED